MASQDTPQPALTASQNKRSRFQWQLKTQLLIPLVICLVLGTFAFGYLQGKRVTGPPAAAAGAATTWTCSMHPRVQLPKPGKCPICFMDLIPLSKLKSASGHPRELTMTPAAVALAEIQTAPVRRQYVDNTIRIQGKVDYDETRLAYITAWVPGRLDRMFIDYTGVSVRKGDHLVSMYSPDLVIAQEELLHAQRSYQRARPDQRAEMARTLKLTEEKLELLGLLREQIDEIKQRGKSTDQVTIFAPTGGIVIHKSANEGMYVKTGTRIYTIADLSQVWVFLDAYESDLPWLRYGQEVEFHTESYPGDIFKGRIAFIDPMLDEKTRTVKVRVNVPNKEGRLKPGMFIRALVKSRLAAGGQVVDESMAGKWISPHHPEIVRDGPGKCPICGIDLLPAEELGFVKATSGAKPPLVVPASAALRTGKRAVVYVKVPDAKTPTFRGRVVLLGQRVTAAADAQAESYHGDYYIVRHGLREGEQVVVNGNFKIDSALQIEAKPSMMSPSNDKEPIEEPPHSAGESPPAVAAAETIDVTAAFRASLTPTYRAYLAASDALAQDDLAKAREALKTFSEALKQIDSAALDSDGRGRWKTLYDRLAIAALETRDATGRTTARRKFHELSTAMLPVVQIFGHALDEPVYQFRCSMAFDNKGAAWLQAGSETRNPYFGPAMLACGDLMSTFHPQVPLNVPTAFRVQLEAIYDDYLALQAALAADQPKQAAEAAGALRTKVKNVDVSMLDDRARQSWSVAQQQLFVALRGDPEKVSMDNMRRRFEPVSLTMLGIVENFGHTHPQPIVQAFCPMAFNNKGAAWLQVGEKIANPFFGAKMLRCGTIKRRFEQTPPTE